MRRGEDWIPDDLTPVKMPNFGVIPDPEVAIPGQIAHAYPVDVWVPADAPAWRVRSAAPLPDLTIRADESATAPMPPSPSLDVMQ